MRSPSVDPTSTKRVADTAGAAVLGSTADDSVKFWSCDTLRGERRLRPLSYSVCSRVVSTPPTVVCA